MNRITTSYLPAALVLAAGSFGTCRASSLVFDMSSGPAGNVGSSQKSITQGAYTITAYGFNAGGSDHNLFTKQNGGDENGLGLVDTYDNELTLNAGGTAIANYIQTDVSAIKNLPGGKLMMGSVTGGESFDVFGSNTLGTPGTSLISGNTTSGSFISIPSWGSYDYITVAVHPHSSQPADNVLFDAISVVPEPGEYASLAGFGLLGFAGWRRWKSV